MTPLIREATEADLGYVLSSWTTDSYRLECIAIDVTKHGRYTPIALYKTLFAAVQAKLLKRSRVTVAVNPDDTDQILGCLVYETGATPVIHYTGSKRDFHELDVGALLYKEAGIAWDKPAVHSGGMPARKKIDHTQACAVCGRGATTFHTQMPKAWSFVRYGLMP